jgi:RNA polymerase sigma factor (sigma-70 family)
VGVERTDVELVEGIRMGDELSWTVLVERYTGRLWATARAQGLSTELAQDVVQTVWLALLDDVDKLHKAESIRFWLTTVARHEAIRVSRRQRRLGDDTPLPYLADATAQADGERVETLDQVAAVRIALTKLPVRCRELLHLLFSEEEFSYREIADLLGRPIGSLGAERGRCLDRLRALLEAG